MNGRLAGLRAQQITPFNNSVNGQQSAICFSMIAGAALLLSATNTTSLKLEKTSDSRVNFKDISPIIDYQRKTSFKVTSVLMNTPQKLEIERQDSLKAYQLGLGLMVSAALAALASLVSSWWALPSISAILTLIGSIITAGAVERHRNG